MRAQYMLGILSGYFVCIIIASSVLLWCILCFSPSLFACFFLVEAGWQVQKSSRGSNTFGFTVREQH